MSDSHLVVALAISLAIVFVLWRLSSSTMREITIPFEGGDLPKSEIRDVLERIGCVVSDDGGSTVTGFVPGDGLSFGQTLTIRVERGHLRVRSSFSDGQAWRASKNQENVEAFKAEWRRRAFRAATADRGDEAFSTDTRARDAARRMLWSGGLMVAAGVGLLALALVPREGAQLGADRRLLGVALFSLAYGVPRAWAAIARLRKTPER